MGYLCAFRGRRDDYQLPLALAEAGQLEALYTDAYAFRGIRRIADHLPPHIKQQLYFRWKEGIPEERIRCLWGTTVVEHLRHQLGISPAQTFASLDPRFSEAVARHAQRTGSDLFLYTPYAWEAFRASYTHTPRKILFQYHPHPHVEHRILTEDRAAYPEIDRSYSEQTGTNLPEAQRMREEDAWRYADIIVCASTFTKQTMIEVGAEPDACVVVPYGIPVVPHDAFPANRPTFQALFVGAGVQRKGLHHLLRAWDRASLAPESELVLVCRYLDPGLEALVAQTQGVTLLRGVSKARLDQLYQESSLFVMPSLVEGFGQVYLEALSVGCPVLGTPNTSVPDLGTADDGVFVTEPRDIDALAAQLEVLSNTLPSDSGLRQRARQCAERFTWEAFREGIRALL